MGKRFMYMMMALAQAWRGEHEIVLLSLVRAHAPSSAPCTGWRPSCLYRFDQRSRRHQHAARGSRGR